MNSRFFLDKKFTLKKKKANKSEKQYCVRQKYVIIF